MLVQLHRTAVALQRRFSVWLHTLPLCGHGSDLSKLLLEENKLLAMAFLGIIIFPGSKLLLILFFPTEFKGAWGSPISANAKHWEGQWKPKPLSSSHRHPDITRAPRALLGGMLLVWWEEGAQVLPARMWTGYSQLLRCSGEKMLPGSPRVTTPKVVQSRRPQSKPPEAEMGKGFRGRMPTKKSSGCPSLVDT